MSNSLNTVAEYIIASVKADRAVEGLKIAAGVNLTRAALATYDTLFVQTEVKVTAQEIGALCGEYGNKDTVARLAEVGRFLTLSGDYAPEGGISPAHFVRTLVNNAMKAVGLPTTRKAIVDAKSQPEAAAALTKLAKTVKAVAAEAPAEGGEDGADTTTPSEDSFLKAVGKAVKALEAAMAAAPQHVTDAQLIEWVKVTDAVTLLDRKVQDSRKVETANA